jgi:hypothetical protein
MYMSGISLGSSILLCSNEIPTLLEFIHSLFEPVLRGNNVFEEVPFRNYDLCELAKIDESEDEPLQAKMVA